MRVVFLSMEYPPETGWGGIGTFVRDTARTLADRGHDVHVLSCVPGQEKSDRIDEGVLVHRRPRLARRLAASHTAAWFPEWPQPAAVRSNCDDSI